MINYWELKKLKQNNNLNWNLTKSIETKKEQNLKMALTMNE